MPVKTRNSNLTTVRVLENTESAKLLDKFVEILKLSPTFKEVKLTSKKAFEVWAGTKSFMDVVKTVTIQAEKRARKVVLLRQ